MDLITLVLNANSIIVVHEECTLGCSRQVWWLEVERALDVQLRMCRSAMPMVLFTRQCAKECS